MDRRRTRLEILAQVTSGDFDLHLRYGDAPRQEEESIQIEDPEHTLERLGGDLGDEHVLRFQKGMTLAEVAHRLGGVRRWAGRAVAANRARPGLFHIWHTLEDARCENRLAESFPGTRKNFRAYVRPSLEGAKREQAEGILPLFAQIRWGLYLTGVGEAADPHPPEPGALPAAWLDPPAAALIRSFAPAIVRACGTADPKKCFEAAGEIYEALRSAIGEEALAGAVLDLRGVETPEEAQEKARTRPKEEEESEGGEEDRSNDFRAEGEDTEGEAIELTPEELARLGHWAAPWFEFKGHAKEVHPTADLPDEATVVIPPEGRTEEYRAVVDGAGSHIKVLAWKLMQLIQERTYTRFGGAHRSGKLNTPKLWKQRLGKYRLFQRRDNPERLDICFILLVDESGSMNRESKYIAAREATVFFAEVLDRLDVPFEIIGYSTDSSEAAMAASLGHVPAFQYRHIRHSPLQHRIYKAFDEPFGPNKTRLVNIFPRFNNWDEEHLLFAYRRLLQRDEKERVIIITSDGQPNGDASHLVATVDRLQKLGVRVVGVGVVDPFVEEIYPNHIVVKHLSQLSEELVGILQRELLGARVRVVSW